MKTFKENNCHVCKKIFCCKICREKHEIKEHDIFPGCDICISGTTIISTTTEEVLIHIKNRHWPLHCIFCKRLFGSVDEIFQHIKCPLANKLPENITKSPYTPNNQSAFPRTDYSPYYQDKNCYSNKSLIVISNLATSTPLIREQGNNLFEKIQKVIVTPVDSSEAKENNSDANSCTNIKRKVTFCDTPITESGEESHQMSPSCNGGSIYFTATDISSKTPVKMQESLDLVSYKKINNNIGSGGQAENENIPQISRVVHTSEKTIWISAVNISTKGITTNISEDFPSPDIHLSNSNFVTPMFPKRKINVVSPSPVIKNEQISIKFEGPIQISSTPNSSTIPVKSAPTIKDIFRNIDQLPSTSKLNLENCGGSSQNFDFDAKYDLSDNSQKNTSSINNSMPNKLWSSVSNMVKNVLQTFSNSTENLHSSAIKRRSSDCDMFEYPNVKRYKVADIKCRKNIREMTPINKFMASYRGARSRELHINIVNSLTRSNTKTFVDKATQTDPE